MRDWAVSGVRRLFRLKAEATGSIRKNAEPAASLLVFEQLGIADAKQWPAQHVDESQLILRISQRPQQNGERGDLRRLAERAGAAHLDRDVQCLECGRVRRNAILLLPGEDEEVAVFPAAGIHLGADVARDCGGVEVAHFLRVGAGVLQREEADAVNGPFNVLLTRIETAQTAGNALSASAETVRRTRRSPNHTTPAPTGSSSSAARFGRRLDR